MKTEQLQTYRAAGYRLLPVKRTYDGVTLDPAEIYERLGWQGKHHFLLESGKMGDFSFVGGEPFATLTAKDGRIEFVHGEHREERTGDPLEMLREKMALFRAPRLAGFPKLRGGAVGFLAYDTARYIERLPEQSRDDLGTPDLYFVFVDKLCVIDHRNGTVHLIAHADLQAEDGLAQAEASLAEMEQKLFHGASQAPLFPVLTAQEDWSYSFSQEAFQQAVLNVQEYIRQGDVFQVNLSVRQGRTLGAAPYEIYKHLRKINPSPYASYLHFPELQLVSSSPELLVNVLQGECNTRPIAGTRPRTGDAVQDRQAVEELRSNEKEIAEHIMLVDLERNDLGRVCRYGSVEVNELMAIEEYSHVFHIVSNVRGQLADGRDAYDVIRATFPGGTITGAPKIRTMEIIEELEPTRRGIYTGSIGWIDFDGDMELNIVIRTLQVQDGKGYVQAGAGIVIDSVPEREYHESLRKAKALWVAIEQAEQAAQKGGVQA
ncbi:aminodeoxychorismate synthase subunit I [Tumebacillus sp. BK434]|uniref:aminodeoxychorismate synthase, component I n=1 Tax=Tumebacillus sp. BK434 TaxID=2512169 RepID=UPI00104D9856|nr:aminodeoxychorismate synthase, component I [Tumebacillus sp. BK434]TCP53376.1 aminodeoxychorismate synthase subunit I [Tumebacillus sp. BK434]